MNDVITTPTEVFTMAQFISLLFAFVSPLIVGFLTKVSWASKLKAYVLLLLSVINGAVTEAVSTDDFDIRVAAVRALTAFVLGVGVHLGLWKPTGAAAVAQNSGVKDP